MTMNSTEKDTKDAVKEMTLEEKTAEAMLQSPYAVTVGRRHYLVRPMTIATLAMLSKEISRVTISIDKDPQEFVFGLLKNASQFEGIGRIIAIMILGAKKLTPHGWLKVLKIPFYRWRLNDLARYINENLTGGEINTIMGETMKRMEVVDFFQITTFLSEINMLKAKKVETKMTASGQ